MSLKLKAYKVRFLHESKIKTAYLYAFSKQDARLSLTKHWNEHLVFGAKIINIDGISEEDVQWEVHQGEEE